MQGLKGLLFVFAVGVAVGCGSPSAEPVEDGEESTSSAQELSECTASCSTGSVSCPAGTANCSATQGQGVTCDGTFYACPTCTATNECERRDTKVCSVPGYELKCCWSNGQEGICRCAVGRWDCL